MTHVAIEPVRQTQLVKINFESYDRQLTAAVANAMAKAYINSQMEARVALTQNAADWLTTRLGTLKTNVEISEKKLQDYREANNLVGAPVTIWRPLNVLFYLIRTFQYAKGQFANCLNFGQ